VNRIRREFLYSIPEAKTKIILKWAKDLNSYLITEDLKMLNKHKNMYNIVCHQGNVN
jgi:hypothetical protein